MSRLKSNVFFRGIISYSFANVFIYFLSFVSVPIAINFFGVSRYGIWIVLMSLMSYLSNSQFGLGTATSVLIAKTEDKKIQSSIFTKSLEILIIISALLLLLGIVFYKYPDLIISMMGLVPGELVGESIKTFGVLYLFFILKLPFIAVTSGFVGHQDVHLERLYVGILPQTLAFIALILTKLANQDLMFMALVTGAGNLVISIVSAIHYYYRNRYFYSRETSTADGSPRKMEILKNGGLFFVAGLAGMIITNTDNLVLNHLFGADKVASYSVTFKIYMIAFSLFFILNSAFWPILGRAFANKEIPWLRTVFVESITGFPLLAGLIWIGGLAFMADFIDLWIGSARGYAGLGVVFALGGYGYISSVTNFQFGLLSSVNSAKTFMWIGITEAFTNITISIALCYWIGPSGVAFGSLIGVVVTSFFILPWAIKKYVHSALQFPWNRFLKHFGFVLLPTLVVILLLPMAGFSSVQAFFAKIVLILIYMAGSYSFIPPSALLKMKLQLSRLKVGL